MVTLAVGLFASWWVPEAPFGRVRGVANDPVFPRGDLVDDVVLVAIDDEALERVGPWPWARPTLAALVDGLAIADGVVLDVLLADAREGDEDLARAIADAGDVVLAAASTALRPVPVLADAAAAIGSTAAVPDRSDGVVRRVPLVLEGEDLRVLPALGLAGALGGAPPIVRPTGVQVGDRLVPTEDGVEMRISWPSGLDARVVSAADVLDGSVDESQLRGRTAYVGAIASALGDRVRTPLDQVDGTPGVLHHVAVHHTIASGEHIARASTGESVTWMVVVALAAALLVQLLPLWVGALGALLVGVAAATAAFARSGSGVLVDVVDPVVAVAVAGVLSGVLRYALEVRRGRRVASLFAEYVPAPVAAALVRDGLARTAAEGQRLDVSLLFCDLRSFTPLAAELAPSDVNRLLSTYYDWAAATVLRHGGTIVQYVGDEVFAVFGAPLPTDDHAGCAVAAARELQAGAGSLAATLGAAGLPPVSFGIGVHTGEVVAAHAGSSARRQYAVIGDPVNVASRLCGVAGAGEVVVSDAAAVASGVAIGGERFTPSLRGVSAALTAHRLVR